VLLLLADHTCPSSLSPMSRGWPGAWPP
jgi:hypothetical protein